ncbi:hypothetical protein [Delftia acidovorans]
MLPDTHPPIQLQQLPRRKKPALRKRASLLLGLALLAVLLLTLTGCSKAGAQEQPTPQEQRIARGAARACQGLTPVWHDDGSHTCLKERP